MRQRADELEALSLDQTLLQRKAVETVWRIFRSGATALFAPPGSWSVLTSFAAARMRPVEHCPVCGGPNLVAFALSSWAPQHLHFAQARCVDCGLLVAQPQASEAEMDFYYKHVFFQEQWSDPEAVWLTNLAAYKRYEFPLMQRLWADWPPPAGGAVAEIGCGYGVLLGLLREAGYRARGYEVSGKAVAFCRARGLDVVQGAVPGVPLPRGTFDLSVAMHVIEHVADPRGFVKEMVELVRPGGVIALVTEDAWISQYTWDRCRARLLGRIPPFRSSTDHTFVFRAEHVKRLLLEAGCDDVRTHAFSHVPDGESFHWRMYKGFFRNLDRMLGHGDYLMAVGRRAGVAIS